MALLLKYLTGIRSILELVLYLNNRKEWLLALGLFRNMNGRPVCRVPNRSALYKLAGMVGVYGVIETMQMVVSRNTGASIIRRRKVEY